MLKINEEIEKFLKEKDKLLSDKEKKFLNDLMLEYKITLDDVRRKLSDIYSKYGDDITFAEMQRYDRLTKFENLILAGVISIYSTSVTSINKHLKQTYKTSYVETTKAMSKALNENTKTRITISFGGPPSEDIIKRAIENPYDRVKWKFRNKGHHEKAIEQIKEEITRGLITGRGYSKTAAEIKDKVNGLANNVVRIVRTESHRVAVKGTMDGLLETKKSAKKLGINLGFKISSVIDNRTREQSKIMDGKMAEYGVLSNGNKGYGFRYPDGVLYQYPGETGNPSWDINDRETVVGVVL